MKGIACVIGMRMNIKKKMMRRKVVDCESETIAGKSEIKLRPSEF